MAQSFQKKSAFTLVLVALLLVGCKKHDSYLDCLNSEMKGATTVIQQRAAIAYCKDNYEITDEEREILRGF